MKNLFGEFGRTCLEVLGKNYDDLKDERIPKNGWYVRTTIGRGAIKYEKEEFYLNGAPVLSYTQKAPNLICDPRAALPPDEWELTGFNPDGSQIKYTISYADVCCLFYSAGYKMHCLTTIDKKGRKTELLKPVIDWDLCDLLSNEENSEVLSPKEADRLIKQNRERPSAKADYLHTLTPSEYIHVAAIKTARLFKREQKIYDAAEKVAGLVVLSANIRLTALNDVLFKRGTAAYFLETVRDDGTWFGVSPDKPSNRKISSKQFGALKRSPLFSKRMACQEPVV